MELLNSWDPSAPGWRVLILKAPSFTRKIWLYGPHQHRLVHAMAHLDNKRGEGDTSFEGASYFFFFFLKFDEKCNKIKTYIYININSYLFWSIQKPFKSNNLTGVNHRLPTPSKPLFTWQKETQYGKQIECIFFSDTVSTEQIQFHF